MTTAARSPATGSATGPATKPATGSAAGSAPGAAGRAAGSAPGAAGRVAGPAAATGSAGSAADSAAGWDLLRAEAGDAADEVAHRTAAVFLTPACVAGGRAAEGLRLLAAAGVRLRHLARVLLDPDEVRAIWAPQSAGFAPHRWAVAIELFTAGPGVVAVVEDGPGGPGAAIRLKALQGASSPRGLRPGQLRAVLGAVNKINNLVHVSADAAATVRELPLLLGPPGAAAAWRAVVRAAPVVAPGRELARLLGTGPDATAGLGAVVERLRWRAFQVARTLAPAGPPAGLGPTLARKVDAAQAIPVRGWLATERWRAGGGTAVAAPFESWLGAGSPVVPAVRLLDDVAAGRSVPPESIGPALAAAGLRPSRWELLALTTEAASAQIEAP